MNHHNTSTPDLSNLIQTLMKDMLKEKIEFLLKEEIQSALNNEPLGTDNARNGYYPRTLDTMYGRVEDLSVPRDRKGEFQTAMFEPYQRRMVAVDELVVQLYQNGVSVRQVGQIMKNLLGDQYSPGTISNITSAVMEDVKKWQERPLHPQYCAIYLDALFVKVRRDVVGKEAIYIAMGITPQGSREILGFYIGGRESSTGWRNILLDLYKRGVREVLIGIFDGLPGLEDAFRECFPKADVQRCVVHKVRHILNKARKKDYPELSEDLKTIYRASTYNEAEEALKEVKRKWSKTYQKELDSWEEDFPVLMAFLSYSPYVRKYFYTTNIIERLNKEVRKRLKTMNSLPNMEAAEKIVYLTAIQYNEKWTTRKLSGFELARASIEKKFKEKYQSTILPRTNQG